jgi:hypothetical protein
VTDCNVVRGSLGQADGGGENMSSVSVRGMLSSCVSRFGRDGRTVHVHPSVAEAAILEKLYEDDVWIDGIGSIDGSPVSVDRDLPVGSVYVAGPVEGVPDRMSDRIAWGKYGPRKASGRSRRGRF